MRPKPDIECKTCELLYHKHCYSQTCGEHTNVGAQCEWNPKHDRLKYSGESCFNEIRFNVGTTLNYHLCSSCAYLPQFKKHKKTEMKR